MENSNLLKEKAGALSYESPVCLVYYVETHKVICASETENVDEILGEW